MPDALFIVDKNYKYLSINKTMMDSVGKKRAEIIGKSVMEVFPKKAGEQIMKNLKKVMKTGKTLNIEETIKVRNKLEKISTRLSLIRNPEGKVLGIVGIVRILK